MDFRLVDQAVDLIGGRFKFCALVQKRVWELVKGARPLVSVPGDNPLDIALEEIRQGKIELRKPTVEEVAAAAEVQEEEPAKAGV